MSAKKVPLSERFWSKVSKSEGCWLFTGVKCHGYGIITVGSLSNGTKKRYRAHRVSWELTHGPIPEGMMVCHKCDNPICVNPDHLFLGTQFDNMQDASNKGRLPGPGPLGDNHWLRKNPKTHCKHGHPFDEANTCHLKNGFRQCRACIRIASADWRARNPRKPKREQHYNKEKTHCKHGHPFVEENIYRTKKGQRFCRTCRHIQSQKYLKLA